MYVYKMKGALFSERGRPLTLRFPFRPVTVDGEEKVEGLGEGIDDG